MADSFQGGVRRVGSAAIVRARVAIQGANLEALTGDETVRVPLARCALQFEGRKVLVRDQQSSVVIWSDDEGFLRALERAQRGVLAREVQRLRSAARRRSVFKWGISAVVVAGALFAAAVPSVRWAVGGGVPSIANRIGESAMESLALPTDIAPEIDDALGVIAERLRPATAPSTRSFRLVLAGYSDAHSFAVPPSTVVVTAGFVCAADDSESVTAVVARELAHLEHLDVSRRIAEAVNSRTAFALLRGDVGAFRSRMLDFADPERCPGFTPEQEGAARQRATVMMASAAPHAGEKNGPGLDWSKIRGEACRLVGR